MRRLLWAVWGVGALVAALAIASLFVAIPAAKSVVDSLGNGKFAAGPQTTSARIAVFGDTQKGLAAFGSLAERAKAERIDLAIHTGDLVSHADKGHYDLALKWIRRANFGVPFVVVPGNHDIKDGNGLFENVIGPRQFAFRWGPVDIVVVDNAVAPPGEAAVERLLAAAKGPILLFMHVPPNDTTHKTLVAKSTYNCFLEMIRKYPVRYVFSGHAHSYTRIEDQGITFIANGVGGDSDSWQFDQKAHLTIVEANGPSIKDRPIVIDPVFSLHANFEHLAIGHVGEVLLRRVWGFPALVLLVLFLAWMFRRLRKRPDAPVQNTGLRLRLTPAKTSEPPDIVI